MKYDEVELQRIKKRFEIAAENANVSVAEFDRDLRYVWLFNPHSDFDANAVIGKRDDELAEDSGINQLTTLKKQVIAKSRIRRAEISFLRSDGRKTYDCVLEPLYDEEGRVTGGISAAIDITERKQTELNKKDLEDRMHFALRRAKLGAWDLDLIDHTITRTIEHDRIFGYNKLLPKWTYEDFIEHVVPEDRIEVENSFKNAIESRGDWDFECRIRRADGEIRWIWASGRHHKDEHGNVRRMAGIVQDITHIRKKEQKTINRLKFELKGKRAALSDIPTSITEASDAVRNDIARELHDQIGQNLLAIGIEIHGLERKAVHPEVKNKLGIMVERVDDLLGNVRLLCNDLRPIWLDEYSLTEVVDKYLKEFKSRSKIACRCSFKGIEPAHLPDNIKLSTYRMLQEALRNVERHASATKMFVDFHFYSNILHLTIKDNGIGMDTNSSQSESFGIIGMKERADLVGGIFQIISSLGKGTEVVIDIPLS